MCSPSGGQNCIIQYLVSSHSVCGRPVLRCTGRSPTGCDDRLPENETSLAA